MKQKLLNILSERNSKITFVKQLNETDILKRTKKAPI
jgi:hypothetical protein